jgi:hypothetical protein
MPGLDRQVLGYLGPVGQTRLSINCQGDHGWPRSRRNSGEAVEPLLPVETIVHGDALEASYSLI